MISRQLQLHLQSQSGMRPKGPSRHRSGRAHWWFEKMRGIVDEAPDRTAATPLSEPAPRAAATAPPAATNPPPVIRPDAPSAPGSYHWKFRRARHIVWE